MVNPAPSRSLVTTASDLTAMLQYADVFAQSNLLPAQFRGRPANVLYAIEYGRALGLHPVVAIGSINVIEGKPTASAGTMSGMIRKAGHKLRVKVTGSVADRSLKAVATAIRSDDPDFEYEVTWDLERAYRAGLIDSFVLDPETNKWEIRARSEKGKPLPWELYPEAMLKARATSEIAREGFEDVMFGIRYTPEEMGAIVNADGEVISGEVVGDIRDEPMDPESQAAADAITAKIQEIRESGMTGQRAAEALADALGEHSAVAVTRGRIRYPNGEQVTIPQAVSAQVAFWQEQANRLSAEIQAAVAEIKGRGLNPTDMVAAFTALIAEHGETRLSCLTVTRPDGTSVNFLDGIRNLIAMTTPGAAATAASPAETPAAAQPPQGGGDGRASEPQEDVNPGVFLAQREAELHARILNVAVEDYVQDILSKIGIGSLNDLGPQHFGQFGPWLAGKRGTISDVLIEDGKPEAALVLTGLGRSWMNDEAYTLVTGGGPITTAEKIPPVESAPVAAEAAAAPAS